jgi:hypothetical protein
VGRVNPRQDFQQRALAGAIAPDQPHHFAFFDFKAYVFQCPDKGRTAVIRAGARIRSSARAAIDLTAGVMIRAAKKTVGCAESVTDQVAERSVPYPNPSSTEKTSRIGSRNCFTACLA